MPKHLPLRIPATRAGLAAVLALMLAGVMPGDAAAQEADRAPAAPMSPRQLAAAADRAAYRYESRLYRLAPTTLGGRRSGPCDERIGRFCFWYGHPDDAPSPPPEPEPEEVTEARTVAVRAHRQWFAVDPSSGEAAGALLRYLIEADRTREAVAAARAHAWAAGRTPESLLLLGMALHEAGDFAAAEAVFDSARVDAEPEQRREWDDVAVLLESGERGRYRDLPDPDREDYHERFWRLADAFLLEEGNERRSAHYARHAWALIHSRAPRVSGKISWGSDHTEILLRYGLPSGRRRIREFGPAAWMLDREPSFVESFGESALSFVPPALLSRGLPDLPEPGVRHEMERDTAPSTYAPVRMHRSRAMELQASRFPDGVGAVLRVDAILPPDTLEPAVPVAPRGLLAVLDTLGREVARVEAAVRTRSDSATVLTAELPVPPGSYVFMAELLDDSTGLAGLSRARVDVRPGSGLALSDLVVARAFGDSLPATREEPVLEPLPSLLIPPGSEVGFYAEVRGLARQGGAARYEVQWAVESAEKGSLLGRAARWVGRQIGVIAPEEPMAIRWEDVSSAGTAPIALTMDLADADPGLYRVTLTLTDRLSGVQQTVERLLRIREEPLPRGRAPY